MAVDAPDVDWLVRPDGVHLAFERFGSGNRRVAVVTHGIFGHRRMAELATLRDGLLEAGWDVVLWDVRGHGDSQGRFSFGRLEWEDLRALVAQLRDAGAQTVAAIGFSFGAFHSILAAAVDDCFDRLVLVCGPKDFRQLHTAIFGGHFFVTMRHRVRRPLQRVRLGSPFQTRVFPLEVVEKIEAPLLFVHGTRDWIVPASHSRALHRAARAPKGLEILDGGLHAEYLLTQMPEALLEVTLGWIDGQPPDATAG